MNDNCESSITSDMVNPHPIMKKGRRKWICFDNLLLKIASAVPAAPKPSMATEIIIYAKWYHCTMDKICINTS